MGERLTLEPFCAEDSFLRHADRKNHIRRGTVLHDVFKDKHGTLSFTYQDDNLRTEAGLDQYQRDKALPSGDLPGLCRLTFLDLTRELEPPLPPRPDPVAQDEKYGHLHCCTDRPIDDAQRRTMAACAERNGELRELVPKKNALRDRNSGPSGSR